MSTFRQIYYQIVLSTKYRKPALNEQHEEELYKYIWGIVKNKKCKLYRINGMPDHIHIFLGYNVNQLIPNLVEEIKTSSNKFILFLSIPTLIFKFISKSNSKKVSILLSIVSKVFLSSFENLLEL